MWLYFFEEQRLGNKRFGVSMFGLVCSRQSPQSCCSPGTAVFTTASCQGDRVISPYQLSVITEGGTETRRETHMLQHMKEARPAGAYSLSPPHPLPQDSSVLVESGSWAMSLGRAGIVEGHVGCFLATTCLLSYTL